MPSDADYSTTLDDTRTSDVHTSPPAARSRIHGWLYRNQTALSRLVAITVVVASVVFGLVLWLTDGFDIQTIGYAGVWLFSFVGAASVLVPVPGTASVCVAAAPAIGLYPLIIGVVSGSAEVLGEMSGYVAGMGGRDVLQKNRHFPRVRSLVLRRGGLVLFVAGVVPNPLFDVAGMAAGSAGYPIRKFIPVVFLAKAIKSTWVAFACYAGIGWIERLVG